MVTDMYWFVVYENRAIGRGPTDGRENIILKNINPVLWAASHSRKYAKEYIIVLHFFQEIPENVALEQIKYNWCVTGE